MLKRSSILCILLASSTIPTIANQSNESGQMQMMLEAISKKYDQETIKKYEAKIEDALRTYLCACVDDASKAPETQTLEKTAKDLLEYLKGVGEQDEAYSITSMSFILSWTKIINELAATITTEQEVHNLQKATDVIRDLVESMFLDPMNQMLSESEEG